MMVVSMFIVIQYSRSFLTAVTPTAVAPTAVIRWILLIFHQFINLSFKWLFLYLVHNHSYVFVSCLLCFWVLSYLHPCLLAFFITYILADLCICVFVCLFTCELVNVCSYTCVLVLVYGSWQFLMVHDSYWQLLTVIDNS